MFGMLGRLLRWLSKESLFGVVGASIVDGGKSLFEEAKRNLMEDVAKQAPPEGRGHLVKRLMNLRDDVARMNLIARYQIRLDCIAPFIYGDADKMEVAILALLQEIKNPAEEEEILKALGRMGERDFDALILMLSADPKLVAFFRMAWALLKEGAFTLWNAANAAADPAATLIHNVNEEMERIVDERRFRNARPGRNLFVLPWQH